MDLFLDTNIFLHFRRFTEIDWIAVTNAEQVRLVIPPVLLRELNEKKDSGRSQKLRKRAQDVLADFAVFAENGTASELRPNLMIEFLEHDPAIDFPKHRLRTDIQDDWLLASVIERQTTCPNPASCAIVTADVGLKLKGRAHGIVVFTPPESLRLPPEADTDAKRIRELEREILSLRAAQPLLSLSFPGGKSIARFALNLPIEFDPATVERELERLRQTLRPLDPPKPPEPTRDQSGRRRFVNNPWAFYSEADVAAYNRSLQEFFDHYAQSAKAAHEHENLVRSSHLLEIGISNSGSAPAKEIVVHMHFPSGFSLLEEGAFPKRPEVLEPPRLPRTYAEKIQEMTRLRIPGIPTLAHLPDLATRSNVSFPKIRQTRSCDVEISVDQLNHGFTERFDSLLLTLDEPTKPLSFHIDYEIHAANLPSPATGKLHVVIVQEP